MKKTLLVTAMVVALAMSTMAGAFANGKGNAPGHGNENAAIQGVVEDASVPALGEITYLFNRAGYHFWFTTNAAVGLYAADTSYHNVYKYSVDDPENWCFLPGADDNSFQDREPYNIGGTLGLDKYYKIWDVTNEAWVDCS